jgi:hypothetical protein
VRWRDFTNCSGQFMSENRRGHNHPGMMAPFEDLQIRSACQRGLDADANFTGLQRRRRDILDLNIFPAVEDGRFHAASVEGDTTSLNRILSRFD